MDTKGGKMRWGGDGVVLNWVIGIDIYTLICIKWITNKNLLYKKINTINIMVKKITLKKRYIHPPVHCSIIYNSQDLKTT